MCKSVDKNIILQKYSRVTKRNQHIYGYWLPARYLTQAKIRGM